MPAARASREDTSMRALVNSGSKFKVSVSDLSFGLNGGDEIAQGCYNALQKLEEALDKYQELDSRVVGISGKSRRVWKRLQWDQKDIAEFRSQITLNVSAFGTFLGQITK
jgi:hypothetical protein